MTGSQHDYAAGFAQGERMSWQHRKEGLFHRRPGFLYSEFDRGYWDGYCPRSSAWDNRKTKEEEWETTR